MKPIKYLELLKQSLIITWKNKVLWIFGFFSLLGTSFNFKWTADDKNNNNAGESIINFMQQHPGIFIGICIALVALCIIFVILKLIGNAAIIKSANNIAVYSQSTFPKIFSEAKKYVWPMFLLGFIVTISLAAIFFVMLVPILFLFLLKAYVLAVLILLVAIVIIIPLAIIAYFLQRFGYYYVVLGNMKTRMALESAYGIFRKNVRESLLMCLVGIGLNMLVAMVVLACLLIIAIVAAPFGFLAYLIFLKAGAIAVVIIAGVIALIILVALLSWYASFMQTFWVLFFQQISLEKKEKKTIEELEAEIKVPSPEVI